MNTEQQVSEFNCCTVSVCLPNIGHVIHGVHVTEVVKTWNVGVILDLKVQDKEKKSQTRKGVS